MLIARRVGTWRGVVSLSRMQHTRRPVWRKKHEVGSG